LLPSRRRIPLPADNEAQALCHSIDADKTV
jgi:hypothetical protein